MPDNDSVCVASQCADSVRKRLSLEYRACVYVHSNDFSTAALHSRIEGRARTSRWLIEHSAEDLAFEDVESATPLDLQLHFVRKREQLVDVFVRELLDAQDMLPVECRVRTKAGESMWRSQWSKGSGRRGHSVLIGWAHWTDCQVREFGFDRRYTGDRRSSFTTRMDGTSPFTTGSDRTCTFTAWGNSTCPLTTRVDDNSAGDIAANGSTAEDAVKEGSLAMDEHTVNGAIEETSLSRRPSLALASNR